MSRPVATKMKWFVQSKKENGYAEVDNRRSITYLRENLKTKSQYMPGWPAVVAIDTSPETAKIP